MSTGAKVALGIGLGLAVIVRLALLPSSGLAGDLLLFESWAGFIATNGLSRAYELPLSFPPVLPWIWAALGVLDSGLRTTSPGHPALNVLMKLPATLADFGLAAIVWWWLSRRGEAGPAWAAAGAVAVLLAPVVIYDSALWGQFEAIYVLPALLATVLAARGRNDAAAVFAAIALMTKPQALPLMVPLAAWFLATSGWRGVLRAAVVGGVVIVVLWLPFVPSGGVAAYLAGLQRYADVTFSVLSLRAWNPWWLVQLGIGSRDFIVDTNPILGPITFRVIGTTLAVLGLLLVAVRIVRRPTAEGLAWGMAAAALVSFALLTTMHERYSYPALVLLPLVWPNRLALAAWLVLAVTISLNVVAAIPPVGAPGSLVPLDGPVGLLGSIVMTVATGGVLVGLFRATATSDGGSWLGREPLHEAAPGAA